MCWSSMIEFEHRLEPSRLSAFVVGIVDRMLVSLIDQLIHGSTAAELVAVAPGKLHIDGGKAVKACQ